MGAPSKFLGAIRSVRRSDFFALCVAVVACVQFAYLFATTHSSKVVAAASFTLAMLAAFWALYRRHECEGEFVSRRLFPLALLLAGLGFAAFFPAGAVPDEPYHFAKSYKYASVIMGQDADSVRAEDAALFTSEIVDPLISNESWEGEKAHLLSQEGSETVSIFDVDGVNSTGVLESLDILGDYPQAKLPSALAIALARAVNLSCIALFYLGRIANFLFSAALIIAAVRIVPRGKNVLMAVALLPMTLHLLGSYSYDAPILGYALLLTALIVRAVTGEGRIAKREIAAIVVTTALLAPCKVVYATLALLVFFVPNSRFADTRSALFAKTLVVVSAVLSILLISATRLFDVTASVDAVDIRGSKEGTFYSFSGLLTDPLGSCAMLAHTLEVKGAIWLFNLVGDSLGWLQESTSAPDYVPVMLLGIVALSCLRSKDDGECLPAHVRGGSVLLVLIGGFGVVLSMWLGWTFTTEDVIQGVQGRYFLPLLPILLLALRPKGICVNYNMAFPLVVSLVAMDGMFISYIAAVSTTL